MIRSRLATWRPEQLREGDGDEGREGMLLAYPPRA